MNGAIYAPHAARVRVRVGEGDGRLTAEWTNELTHGDSAGRAVHRWVTKGTRFLPARDVVHDGGVAYMVDGEVALPNGQVQRMTEVALPASPR